MFKEHQGAECIGVTVTENEVFEDSISVSASVKNGKTLVTIGNLSCSNEASVLLESVGVPLPVNAEMTVLYNDDMHAHNTFENKNAVSVAAFDGFETTADGFKTVLPPCSVVKFVIR
jgi:alpha-L-arabinofuranosidase